MPSRFLEDMGHNVSYIDSYAKQQDSSFDEAVMPFDINDRVRSPQFGVGEVVDVDGMAVTVQFDSGETRKLNIEYAQLALC